MSCGFTVTDPLGVVVTLRHATWDRHFQRRQHLEVVPYLGLFANIAQHPDVIVVDLGGQRHYLRYLDVYWLHLIWRAGQVRTWRLVPPPALPDGRTVWPLQYS